MSDSVCLKRKWLVLILGLPFVGKETPYMSENFSNRALRNRQSINQSINQFINQSLNSGFQYSSTWIHIGYKKFRGISYSRIDHELQIRVHMTPQINVYSMWTCLSMPAKLSQHFVFLNSNRCSLIWPLSVLLVCDTHIKSKRKCKEK